MRKAGAKQQNHFNILQESAMKPKMINKCRFQPPCRGRYRQLAGNKIRTRWYTVRHSGVSTPSAICSRYLMDLNPRGWLVVGGMVPHLPRALSIPPTPMNRIAITIAEADNEDLRDLVGRWRMKLTMLKEAREAFPGLESLV